MYVEGNIYVRSGATLYANSVYMDGNIQADRAAQVQVFSASIIGGDLQAFDNHESVTIWNNVIDGNLQCQENIVEPTGGDNQVSGNMEDQCADLQPGDWNYQLFLPISHR